MPLPITIRVDIEPDHYGSVFRQIVGVTDDWGGNGSVQACLHLMPIGKAIENSFDDYTQATQGTKLLVKDQMTAAQFMAAASQAQKSADGVLVLEYRTWKPVIS